MKAESAGIHHITAIAGDPQKNLEFYAGVLGLRLVKKTVNYDDPETYHFYFGDRRGTPGTILTFFPWTASGLRGRAGCGQVTGIAFSVPAGALGFWRKRLDRFGVESSGQRDGGDEARISFHDPDGLSLELVDKGDPQSSEAWDAQVPAKDAIRGFSSATLSVPHAEKAAEFLSSVLGLKPRGEKAGRLVLEGEAGAGSVAEIAAVPPEAGRMGVGTVHHIAWRVHDDTEQKELRAAIIAAGRPATPVIDRTYFHSVYFQEPSGILFELATDQPGFTRDEPEESLGLRLSLPPWLERLRPGLEKALPPTSLAGSSQASASPQQLHHPGETHSP